MSNYIYTNDGLVNVDELMHYGVPGMKWGHRKPQSYVTAKKNRKQALREYRDATRGFRSYGVDGIKRANKAEKKYVDADVKLASERVKYKTSKAKNKEKAELKAYTKEFTKSGLPGSGYDRQTGGRSTALYDKVVKDKGKTYADKVVKKAQNRTVTALVATGVVAVGMAVAQGVLESRM